MPLDDSADRLAEAQRLWQESQALAAISKALSAKLDKQGVIEVVCNAARTLAEADGACVILREGETVYYSREDAIAPLWAGQRFPIGNCISGWSILHRTPVVIEDVYADDRIPIAYYRATFVKSLAIMPMQPETPFGAIGVYWGRRHRASERQLKLLETLADLACTAMANAEWFDEARAARAQAERHAEALQKQAELIDQSSDALLIWEIEGGITFWNRGAEQLYGYTKEEALGRVSHELLRTLHPLGTREFEALLREQRAWQGELSHITKDGRRITVESRCKVAGQNGRTYVTESNRDITGRALIMEALREGEERLRLALEAGQVGTWDWDIASNRVTWSEIIYRFHGLKPGEFGGGVEDFGALIHPDDFDRVNAAIAAALKSKEPYSIEMRIVQPDGTVRWIATNGKAIYNAEGQPVRMLGATVDVTDRKLAEDALKEADRRKDEFLAMLAHELRNPLAPIRNAAQVLKLIIPSDANQQWAREIIERQTQHLTRLVDDLLDVSRITQGKVKLAREPLDLTTVIHRAVETSRPLIDARHHQLTVTLAPDSLRVEGDPTRLVQVVGNLLNNAAKYTDEGGRIELEAAREGQEAVVRVRDNGMGLPADLLPHVFDLFTQADRSLDRSQGGLGIGLTLVRQLVEMHGGRVEAKSEGPGHGSEFTLRLPLSQAAGATQTDPSAAGQARQGGRALKILVVEDNVDSAEMLAFMLRLGGHDIRIAHNGAEALEAAHAFAPQIVLCDIGLPGMNGYEVAARLRGQTAFNRMPLIALTGYGQDEARRRAREAGFDYHLTKPVEPEALAALLAALVADGRAL